MGKLVIFTGQPGVNINGTMQRLADKMAAAGVTYQTLKVEPQMILEHLRRAPGDPNNGLINTPTGMQYLLAYPKDYVRSLWEAAVGSTLNHVDGSMDFVFLATHAISYHTKSREFFTTTNPRELSNVLRRMDLKVEKVVTFIDDVYDVIRRLRGQGHVFEIDPVARIQRAPLSNWLAAHFDLIRLFDWRAEEILASEDLARDIGAPHFVLAVKHPVEVALGLIAAGKIPAYLSHSISEIRRLRREGLTEFADQAIQEIQFVARLLLGSDCIVPFFPTTIDELIVRREGQLLTPRCDDRWPWWEDEALFVAPEPGVSPNPLDPYEVWGELKMEPQAASSVSAALGVMTDWIEAQIASRDRKLVEQSKVLVVYRPYYNGAQSGGVTGEIDHRNSLVDFGLQRVGEKLCIVGAPPGDLARFRQNQLTKEIAAKCVTANGERIGSALLREMASAMMETQAITAGFLAGNPPAEAVQALAEERFRLVLEEATNPYGALGGERRPMLRLEARRRWRQMIEAAAQLDPVREMMRDGDLYRVSDMSPNEFVRAVNDRICGEVNR